MTADDFRELALSMDGAVEGAHMKHPDFRANGRIFATLKADGESGVVKLSPAEQREFIGRHPAPGARASGRRAAAPLRAGERERGGAQAHESPVFGPAAGAWGRQGWTTVLLAAATKSAVRGAVILAYQAVVAQPPPKGRPR